MRTIFTDDFYKNLIGFATILLIGIGITAIAGNVDEGTQTARVPEEVHK